MAMGDSFVNGFLAVDSMRQKKLQRQFEAEQAQKRMDQDLKMQSADQALRREMQQRQLDADVDKMGRTFAFQGGEADKDRAWRTGERQGSQTFQGSENAASRALTQAQIDARMQADLADRALREREFGQRQPLIDAQTKATNEQAATMAYQRPDRTKLASVKQPLDPMNPDGGFATFDLPVDQVRGGGMNTPGARPSFGANTEGKLMKGPDGRIYRVTNGKPVPVSN